MERNLIASEGRWPAAPLHVQMALEGFDGISQRQAMEAVVANDTACRPTMRSSPMAITRKARRDYAACGCRAEGYGYDLRIRWKMAGAQPYLRSTMLMMSTARQKWMSIRRLIWSLISSTSLCRCQINGERNCRISALSIACARRINAAIKIQTTESTNDPQAEDFRHR